MSSTLAAAVAPVAARYRLALLFAPRRGQAGEVLTRRTGGTMEFEDFRNYSPGDDPRHIDWAAYARTDQLLVRLHQAELRLSVEVLLDRSRSMASGCGSKAARAREVALLVALVARRAGAAVRFWAAGDTLERVPGDPAQALADMPFDSRAPLPEVVASRADALEAGSVRVVISDFLFPHDPEALHSRLARSAGGLALVQILDPQEAQPSPRGAVQLVDVETGEDRPLWMDPSAIATYRARLAELVEGLARACRRTQALFASTVSSLSLDEICRRALAPARLIEPAPSS